MTISYLQANYYRFVRFSSVKGIGFASWPNLVHGRLSDSYWRVHRSSLLWLDSQWVFCSESLYHSWAICFLSGTEATFLEFGRRYEDVTQNSPMALKLVWIAQVASEQIFLQHHGHSHKCGDCSPKLKRSCPLERLNCCQIVEQPVGFDDAGVVVD